MAAGRLIVPSYAPARDRNGDLIPGALLYVYQNKTTIPVTVYSNEALTVPRANPVEANSSGQFPDAWLDAGTESLPVQYSVAVTTADGQSPGNPSTFDDITPSLALGIINADLKQDIEVSLYAGGADRTISDILKDQPVSIWTFFNLVVDGDWSYAARAANLAKRVVYWPEFTPGYRIDREVLDRPEGNFWKGDGVTASVIRVDWQKLVSGTRWIRKIPPSASSNMAGMDGIGFDCVQPDQNVRANIKTYPWMIDAPNVARMLYGDIRISGATLGVNWAGNTGGLVHGSLEFGCSDIGMQLGGAVVQKWTGDGSNKTFFLNVKSEAANSPNVFLKAPGGSAVLQTLTTQYSWVAEVLVFVTAPPNTYEVIVAYPPSLDFTKGTVLQNWPFGWESARLDVFWDGNQVAANVGRVDGWALSALCNFAGLINIQPEPASGEGPFGNIGILQCDSKYARIDMTAGRMGVGTAYLSTSGTDAKSYGINTSGTASLTVSASVIAVSPGGVTVPYLQNSAYLSMNGGQVQNLDTGRALARSTGGFFQFNDFTILAGTNLTRTSAAINITGGRAHIKGNLFPYAGSGGGPQIQIVADDAHVICDNSLVGWGYSVPALGVQGQYGPNALTSDLYGVTVTTGTFDPSPYSDTFFLQATGPITAFNVGKVGRVIRMTFGGAVQINPGATIKLEGDGYAVYNAGDTTTFTNVNQVWQEGGRSVNGETRFRDLVCADPLPLNDLDHGKTVYLSGVASVPSIGTIATARKGTRVVLRFDGATTVNGNSASIKLSGLANRVTAARTTLELVSNGSLWEQVSASVNS